MYNPFTLEGKTILVTGASSGIGRAVAIECSKMGAVVFLTARNEARLRETLAAMEGSGHQYIVADLTEEEAMKALVEQLPQLDGVVLNAGIAGLMPTQAISPANLQEMQQINLNAPILLTKNLVKKRKFKNPSSIVFTSSAAGVYRTSVGNAIYATTKCGIDAFMRTAALELASRGIRCNSVNPAMVETVTDYDDGLVAGVVPGLVEGHQALGLEGLQVFLRADEGAGGLLAVGAEVVGEGSLHAAPAGVAAGAAFLDDDSALGVNLLGVVEHVVGIVGQDHEAAVHHGFPLDRDVVEHILRLFKAGGGVDVAAELGTDGTQVVQNTLVGEVGRSVEAHVLQEVGQAVLGRILFLNGAHVGGQVEFGTALGELVVTDKIGETVVQLAHRVGIRDGNLRHLGNHGLHLLAGGLLGKRQGGAHYHSP